MKKQREEAARSTAGGWHPGGWAACVSGMWGSVVGKAVSGARKVYARLYSHLQAVRPLSQPQRSRL